MLHEKVYAMHKAFQMVEEQLADQSTILKLPFSRDLYETWYNIEKSIHRLDRVFNKVEKFNARAMNDPENHERREARMIDRRNKRWNQNYTFFRGKLTEEEQQYFDYYESDEDVKSELREPEDWGVDSYIALTGQMDPDRFDFQDLTMNLDLHEGTEDVVEKKIFKFKYRRFQDDDSTY